MAILKLKVARSSRINPATKQKGFAARVLTNLGPIGKLYPSCTSGWYEKAEDMSLDDVKPGLYFRPGDEVQAAVKAAKLVWAKASDEDDDEEGGSTPAPSTPTTPETPENPGTGGDNTGGGDDDDSGVIS